MEGEYRHEMDHRDGRVRAYEETDSYMEGLGDFFT